MNRNKAEHDVSTAEKNPENTILPSMSSDKPAEKATSSAFLVNLIREQGITDVSLVSDNAKPRATVPRSVFLQSPTSGREQKSSSRWDSIPRTESLDALDNWNRNRRITTSTYSGERRRIRSSYSLSPSSLLQGRKSVPSENFEKSITSLKRNNSSSNLPTVLRDNLLELVGTDGALTTPGEKLNRAAGLCGTMDSDSNSSTPKPASRRASADSDISLLMPQRRAFIDPHGEAGISKPRRAGRRASYDSSVKKKPSSNSDSVSLWWHLRGDEDERAKDENGSDSTEALTPSPTNPIEAATKILKLANNPIRAPPLNSPPKQRKTSRRKSTGSLLKTTSKSKKSQRAKSPPPPQPGTPPTLRRGQRKPRDSKRNKSPPPQRPATPPSLKRDFRSRKTRRHSDSIINIDMEVSQKLLHLAQISSPVQPVRRRSLDKEDLETRRSSSTEEDFESDQELDGVVQSAMEKAQQYIGQEESETTPSEKDERGKQIGNDLKAADDTGPKPKVHFSPQVSFNSSQSKKNSVPRVCFSPRRQHSAPLQGVDSRRENDNEASLLASFRRRKPFSPGSTFTKTVVTTSKTGDVIRSRKNASRTSNNRDIVKSSFLEHEGEEGEYWFNPELGHSSMGDLEKVSMVDILAAPSLDTPQPKAGKKKKSSRRTSMPPEIPPLRGGTPPQTKKKKKSKRRSVN